MESYVRNEHLSVFCSTDVEDGNDFEIGDW